MARPPCRYCTLIREHASGYKLRPARHALDTSFPRCDLHWRVECGVLRGTSLLDRAPSMRRRAAALSPAPATPPPPASRGFLGGSASDAQQSRRVSDAPPTTDRLALR